MHNLHHNSSSSILVQVRHKKLVTWSLNYMEENLIQSKTEKNTSDTLIVSIWNTCVSVPAQTTYIILPLCCHPHLRAILKLFGKSFLCVCPWSLHNCPCSALSISQAWNVGPTKTNSTVSINLSVWETTKLSFKKIKGIMKHLHSQWISPKNKVKSQCHSICESRVLMHGLSSNEMLWFCLVSWLPIWGREVWPRSPD